MRKRLSSLKSLRLFGMLFLGAFLSCQVALAQTQISGTVTDETGSAVPGTSVLVKGTTTGTVTDVNGSFSLSVSPEDVLVFSFVGFESQEITVGNRTTLDVTMMQDATQLQEIVVTGYATQQKKDLTGAVDVVQPSELTAIPTGNVANQLQGRASGVTVVGSGEPGSTNKVRIRGFGSFQNNDPLYIVDGVPTQNIDLLNPDDIASLTVLKDAGAASIYGSRASNGVIIITTKSGKRGVQFAFDMYIGSQNPGDGPGDLVDTQGYADTQWLVYDNDGTVEDHPIYGPSSQASPSIPSWGANTNWYDEFTDPATIQNYNAALSGGNEKSEFFSSVNWFRQDGIVINTWARRFSARFNSEFTFGDDRVKVGENFTVSQRNQNGVTNLAEGSPIQMGSYRSQPIIPVIWNSGTFPGLAHTYEDGDWGGTGIAPRLGNGSNVVAQLTRDKDDLWQQLDIIGNLYVDVKIVDGLNFRSTIGGKTWNGYNTNYTFATYEDSENVATPNFIEGAWFGSEWVWTNTLTYDAEFGGQHRLLAILGYEAVEYGIGRNVSGQRNTYFSNDLDYRTLNTGANVQNANSSFNTPTTLTSIFLRADYAFKDKYLLGVTVRRDGSSRFGADNRYGTFPSLSAGWRISDEPFLAGGSAISELKIRGSWGQMGNQLAVDPANQFFLYGGSQSTSFYDINGTGTSSAEGFRPTRIGNPDAKWEANVTTNIGFDAGFADNKIEFIFDWYQKDTQDLLFNPELPGTAGAATQPFVNIASMKNNGIDMTFIYRNQWGDFGFDGSAVFTTYNNEITKIAEGVDFFDWGDSRIGPFSRNEVGQAMSSFYGYNVIGLFQSDSEANSSGQDGAEAGFFQYGDNDGVSGITPDDRDYIGNPNPNFTYGLNLTFTYKAFDLTLFGYGSSGGDIFNWNRWWIDFWPSFQGQKSTRLLNESWTPSNTGATTPKASNSSNFSTNTQSVSYYIEKGGYMRLKNLQLGFNFPQSVLDKLDFTKFRIYIQGVNAFTVTDYTGLDPELSGDDRDFGVDRGNYPTVKQWVFGLNLGL